MPAISPSSETPRKAVGSSESAETENHPPATELPAVAPQAESETEAPAIAEALKPAGSDAEVMAAIASLAPTNGHATESMQAVPEGSYGIGHIVPNSPYSSGAAESSVTGPRWIAESVAVAVEESTLVLEHEMEQARAASAVLEAVNRRNESTSSTLSVASSVEPEISGDSGKAAVESVPTSISTDTGAVGSPPIGDSESATVNEEAAYAAAASAGSVADYAAPVESAPPTATSPQASEDESKTQSDVGTRRETELAAAWQNWKQIRESFVGSQPDSQVSEAASQALDTDQKETATSLNSETAAVAEQADDIEAAADTPAESTAIASIVDSMLAELRPKLVEEIAKKMNSEKREKEKKKKK